MNGYLVVLRCQIDDVPLKLSEFREVAFDFANKVTDEDGAQECSVLGIDRSEACNVSVYEFNRGRLVKFTVVKDFTE